MIKRALLTSMAALLLMPAALSADETPTFKGPLSASEQQFVQSIQADLGKRFPHASDAEKAGFVRYTNADDSGAISYANRQWTSQDIQHPSQLWYDKNGDLLGADFSVPNTDGKRPNLFGVDPGRWSEFDDHIHWVAKDPTSGEMTYDHWVMAPKFVAAGGDMKNPSVDTLVKLGKVKTASSVTTIFDFPTVWDLIVWTKTNPNGAFADKNPLITP